MSDSSPITLCFGRKEKGEHAEDLGRFVIGLSDLGRLCCAAICPISPVAHPNHTAAGSSLKFNEYFLSMTTEPPLTNIHHGLERLRRKLQQEDNLDPTSTVEDHAMQLNQSREVLGRSTKQTMQSL